MRALIDHTRRHAVGYVALFVALGGTGYAAANLPRGSVGARQLKNHSIGPVKFNPRLIGGNVRAWAVVTSDGRVLGGGGRPRVFAAITAGVFKLSWGVNLKRNCASVASIDALHSPPTESLPASGSSSQPAAAGYAAANSFTTGTGRFNNGTFVHTFNQQGQLTPLGFDLIVVC